VGLGDAVQNPKILDNAVAEVAAITGQKPIITRARKSIASFKLREGMPIGVRVTLRRERMWEFMDRLVSLSLPRVRDFRGISRKAFDGAGNYTLGLKEQIVFPEVDFDKVDHNHGMNITFVTSAKTNEEARELLGKLGMPFRN
jgi:large subunit ribosomal protein L5